MVQFHEPLDQGGGVHRFHQHRCLVSSRGRRWLTAVIQEHFSTFPGCSVQVSYDGRIRLPSICCFTTEHGLCSNLGRWSDFKNAHADFSGHFETRKSLIRYFFCSPLFGRWRKAGAADGAGHPWWYKSRSWKDWTHDCRGGDGDPEVKYYFSGPIFAKQMFPFQDFRWKWMC